MFACLTAILQHSITVPKKQKSSISYFFEDPRELIQIRDLPILGTTQHHNSSTLHTATLLHYGKQGKISVITKSPFFIINNSYIYISKTYQA